MSVWCCHKRPSLSGATHVYCSVFVLPLEAGNIHLSRVPYDIYKHDQLKH